MFRPNRICRRVASRPQLCRSFAGALPVLLLVSLSGAQTRSATSPAPPTTLPTRLGAAIHPTSRYQELPAQLLGVHVGPDGRIWSTLKAASPGTLASVRKLIAREFDQSAPEISWAIPVLFEPGGRVWFFFRGPADDGPGAFTKTCVLLAYDGKTFLERPVPDLAFEDSVPNRYRAVYVAKRAFFATRQSVLSFDGSTWTTHENTVPTPDGSPPPRLVATPDDGVMAVFRNSPAHMWLWRDEKWRSFPSGLPTNGVNTPVILGIAPTPKCLYLQTTAGAEAIPWDRDGAEVKKLIGQLGSADFATREAARKALAAFGPSIRADLEKARAAKPDDETLDRINTLLADLNQPRPLSLDLGDYRLSLSLSIIGLPGGRALFAAASLTNRAGDPVTSWPASDPPPFASSTPPGGVLHLDETGKITLIGGPSALRLYMTYMSFGFAATPPCLARNGTALWLTPGGQAAPTLVELATGEVLARFPAVGVDSIIATTSQDVAYAWCNPGIISYDPRLPDSRTLVKPHFAGKSLLLPVLAPDDAVWISRARGEFTRTAGAEKAQTFRPPADGTTGLVFAGKNAAVTNNGSHFSLISGDDVFSADSIEKLIAEHPAEVTRGFRRSTCQPWLEGAYSTLHTDPAGNIWLFRARTREFKVFTRGQWTDLRDTLVKGGIKSGKATIGFPLGDGSATYVCDWAPEAGTTQTALIVRFKDDQLVAAPAPRFFAAAESLPLFEPDGAAWIPANVSTGALARDGTARLTPDGVDKTIVGFRPVLRDHAGGLWLTPTNAGWHEPHPLALQREDKTFAGPMVPGYARLSRGFLVGPGQSIYVVTRLGLQEYHAATPAGHDYIVGPLLYPDGDFLPLEYQATSGGSILAISSPVPASMFSLFRPPQ